MNSQIKVNIQNASKIKKKALLSCFFMGTSIVGLPLNISLENNFFEKRFIYSNHSGPIQIEYIDKTENKSILSNTSPYFEFIVNHQKITSSDSIWTFKNSLKREMLNGGTEYQITFKGSKEPVKGLNLTIFQQVFQETPLIREKLELRVDSGYTFQLNKLEDQLHFVFPQYVISKSISDTLTSTEINIASWNAKPLTFGNKRKRKKSNHMYYPSITTKSIIESEKNMIKGPIQIVQNRTKGWSWITTYEHASQDNLNGMFSNQSIAKNDFIVDAMQGTKGVFNFPVLESDFHFLGISTYTHKNTALIGINALRGAYLDGELIDINHPYASVWVASAFQREDNIENNKALIRDYLMNRICEKEASRKPDFYYNTWGMQRTQKEPQLRDVLTYEKIFEEITYAAQLGVDLFVLDDGWEEAQGIWTPNKKRLPEGLAPIKKELEKYNMKLGVWFSPMGIDSTTLRYKQHKNWVIKDSENNPIKAQWGHPAFDFVSDFYDLFIKDCKALIDQGVLFFKWDAINTFYSTLPNLHHGSSNYSPEEIRARYEYLLPIYVTKAMEELTDYEPELVIEIDLTEARRVMTGLAPLSQGKLFWMNNGASGYNDYSAYRTQSTRTIINEYAGIIPLELFTFANYPHNQENSLEYNVNTSLIAGHGFWGSLELMSEKERLQVGKRVHKAKLVLPYLTNTKPEITGKVGDSPEIYAIVNKEKSIGQVIGFSTSPSTFNHQLTINSSSLLAVLNTPYSSSNDTIDLSLHFESKNSTSEAFILSNHNQNISIFYSSSILDFAETKNNELHYKVLSKGAQSIKWGGELGEPTVQSDASTESTVIPFPNFYIVEVDVMSETATITVRPTDK